MFDRSTKEMNLALKVDLDTLIGTREGVPRLRGLLDERGIPASFFFSLGPDNSGRAAWRVFTRPGFLAKQIRSKAASAFGWRTLLYGTLLPAPIIGRDAANVIKDLAGSSHETGLHAWDHVKWHDRAWQMNEKAASEELMRGIEAYRQLTGKAPQGFAAPGWRIDGPAAAVLEVAGLTYMSSTRGREPYLPRLEGRVVGLIEIPTTLPTADENLGRNGLGPDDLPEFFLKLLKPGLNVLTIHGEMEGRILADPFARFLDGCLDRGVKFVRLIDLARELADRPESLPVCDVIRVQIPGRAGKISRQAA
jgi:peptidoglycan/xylan/chitin deacetylase (PgdA/CDA1 family)